MISLPKRPISSYMSTPLMTLKSSDTIFDALHLFNHNHIHGAPVIDDGYLAGIFTLSDLANALEEDRSRTTKVSEIMTHGLIVVENGRLVGILTQSDILRVLPSHFTPHFPALFRFLTLPRVRESCSSCFDGEYL
ncbi:MAG: hypothetical protein METHP_01416 [Methanoregula sp. SKADARSKE-2]|nr:MAG: hypothetical protein METHP_01416 [Methanoregula sp. SKADARSKE-2]